MAAAEARAAWQRTANRCFVQEDAKRAPKLACVPSLSKQIDPKPTKNNLDDYTPATANSIYSNLSPDSRWWLQLQPNYIHQQGLTPEKVNNSQQPEKSHQFVDIMESQSTVKGDSLTEEGMESYEFVEMDSVFEKVDEFNLDSEFPHWMEGEKSHDLPWWRLTDKDDLASFVAQRSHDFIENCDLPQPQNRSFKRDLFSDDRCLGKKDEGFTSFGSLKPQKSECKAAGIVHASKNASSGPLSPLSTQSVEKEPPTPEIDSSKQKLLEALRHSQTRAREAEKAAKQALSEKEHVVKLIFKQASQLFAYKQWLYLLQLENLYNQIKTNKLTPIFPASPWHVPRKKTRRNGPPPAGKKKTRVKQSVSSDDNSKSDNIGKYGVAFVVGLGLVGAGLLLGWTVGWMFI